MLLTFGKRSTPPCGDCDRDGECTMNCGPRKAEVKRLREVVENLSAAARTAYQQGMFKGYLKKAALDALREALATQEPRHD